MKITIELDESRKAAPTVATAGEDTAPAAAASLADGGAGPNGEGGFSLSGAESDGGGPTQALLDAIAAAEATGHWTADAATNAETDAGAGPAGSDVER